MVTTRLLAGRTLSCRLLVTRGRRAGRVLAPAKFSIKTLEARDRPARCPRRIGQVRGVSVGLPFLKKPTESQKPRPFVNEPVRTQDFPGVSFCHAFTLRLGGDPRRGVQPHCISFSLNRRSELEVPQF